MAENPLIEALKKANYTLVEDRLPEVDVPVFVATSEFRCLGSMNSNREWQSQTGRKLPEKVIAWKPVSEGA